MPLHTGYVPVKARPQEDFEKMKMHFTTQAWRRLPLRDPISPLCQ